MDSSVVCIVQGAFDKQFHLYTRSTTNTLLYSQDYKQCYDNQQCNNIATGMCVYCWDNCGDIIHKPDVNMCLYLSLHPVSPLPQSFGHLKLFYRFRTDLSFGFENFP